MLHTLETTETTSTDSTPTHCVFRCGACWHALPATAVREVLPTPEMVEIPGSPQEFVGLCHVRSEFIPVLDPGSFLPDGSSSSHQIMLILDDADGPWAVLVDEVSALKRLEISDAPEGASDDDTSTVIGWATVSGAVIQVLDQARIRRYAEKSLATMWQQYSGQSATCAAGV